MMVVIISIVGILFVGIGTVWSVWSILSADIKYIGTIAELARRREDFLIQRKQVICGLSIIVFGSFLQIAGVLISFLSSAN